MTTKTTITMYSSIVWPLSSDRKALKALDTVRTLIDPVYFSMEADALMMPRLTTPETILKPTIAAMTTKTTITMYSSIV